MNDDYSKANGNKLSTAYLVTILNDLNGSYLSPFLVGMCTIYDKKVFLSMNHLSVQFHEVFFPENKPWENKTFTNKV